ncbi:MAG: serine hydrolase domain-containing protein [Gemmatimonadales bacterium]
MTLRRLPWKKAIAVGALLAPALAIGAWRATIWRSERTQPVSGTFPTCPGRTDHWYLQAIERARAHVEAMMAERRIPGLAVAVAVDGRTVWSEGFGYADVDARRPACPQTQFRLQSVSKPVTAAVMARLVEAGRLDLDAPIQTYVPSFPAKQGTITARALASHRAGIRHYRDDVETLSTKHYGTATASLEHFQDDSLLFPPDSGFTYSSYGFVLLSAAIETACGADFPTCLERHLFAPLAMRRSAAEVVGRADTNRASFYDNVTPFSPDGTTRPSPFVDFSWKWAGGGVLSSAEDMARFGMAHIEPHNRRFLSRETIDMLFSPRTGRLGTFGYGLGWMVARDARLRRVRFHFGAGSGGTSFLAVLPDRRVSVAVLANLGHAGFSFPRLSGIVNPFAGDPLAVPAAAIAAGFLALALIAVLQWRRSARATSQ